MENLSYDLIKLLHNKLDDHWRITKHYLKDAKKCRRCAGIFKEMVKTDKKMIDQLRAEIGKHHQEKSFK